MRRRIFHRLKIFVGQMTVRVGGDDAEGVATGEVRILKTFMEINDGQRLVGRFAPRPFYYISYYGNDAVMRELNYAIADIKMYEPELETKLMNQYFQSRLDTLFDSQRA